MNKTILEIRERKSFVREIKIDNSFLENSKYLKNMCSSFRY